MQFCSSVLCCAFLSILVKCHVSIFVYGSAMLSVHVCHWHEVAEHTDHGESVFASQSDSHMQSRDCDCHVSERLRYRT